MVSPRLEKKQQKKQKTNKKTQVQGLETLSGISILVSMCWHNAGMLIQSDIKNHKQSITNIFETKSHSPKTHSIQVTKCITVN